MGRGDDKRRVLPHSLDAEMSILGGILIDNTALARVPWLEPDHFYDPKNRLVFAAFLRLAAAERPIDLTTAEVELQRMGKLDGIGTAYLGVLAGQVPIVENVVAYAEDVRGFWQRRRLMLLASELLERGYNGTMDDPVREAAELAADAARHVSSTHITLGAATRDERVRVDALLARKDAGEDVYACMPTGFRDIDYNLGGGPFGQMTILEGLRGGAKTLTLQTMAEYGAKIAATSKGGMGKAVVFAFNEDQPSFLAQRSIARQSGGSLHTEMIGRLQLDQQRRAIFRECAEQIAGTKERPASPASSLILLPCAGMDGVQLGRILTGIHSEFGLAAFYIDYLQRMRAPRGVSGIPEAIRANSQEISNVAQDTGAAAFVAAQLDPGIEQRDWKKEGGPVPRMGDIRWSRDPESDARVILALFDLWKYGVRTLHPHVRYDPRPDRAKESPLRRDVLEVHCLKRNQGDSEMMFHLQWIREAHLVRDLPREDSGHTQLSLTRTADDEEAWRLRMEQGEGAYP